VLAAVSRRVRYALNVDPRDDNVWSCGPNSDTLIRFAPDKDRFTIYPLSTRVTYTRSRAGSD